MGDLFHKEKKESEEKVVILQLTFAFLWFWSAILG